MQGHLRHLPAQRPLLCKNIQQSGRAVRAAPAGRGWFCSRHGALCPAVALWLVDGFANCLYHIPVQLQVRSVLQAFLMHVRGHLCWYLTYAAEWSLPSAQLPHCVECL